MKNYSTQKTHHSRFSFKHVPFIGTLLLLFGLLVSPQLLWAQTGVLGDKVWNDANENGVQDTGEPGMGGIQVDLEFYIGPASPTSAQLADPANWSTGSTSPATRTTTTSSVGAYTFRSLAAGYYRLKFYLADGYQFTTPNAPSSPASIAFAKDSDAGDSGYTPAIYLTDGLTNNTYDAGMYLSPLPVKLATFDIKKGENNSSVLTWTTAEEKNSSYFGILHSTDGRSWVEIAKVSAKGDHTGLVNYQYADQVPRIGVHYYRLKMVDTDQTFTYSKIKTISFGSVEKALQVTVYPNPVSERLFVQNTSGSTIVEAKLLNSAGRVALVAKPSQLEAGIDVKGLSDGMYILNVSLENGKTVRQKVMITK